MVSLDPSTCTNRTAEPSAAESAIGSSGDGSAGTHASGVRRGGEREEQQHGDDPHEPSTLSAEKPFSANGTSVALKISSPTAVSIPPS